MGNGEEEASRDATGGLASGAEPQDGSEGWKIGLWTWAGDEVGSYC
jgi:hypothetical protein